MTNFVQACNDSSDESDADEGRDDRVLSRVDWEGVRPIVSKENSSSSKCAKCGKCKGCIVCIVMLLAAGAACGFVLQATLQFDAGRGPPREKDPPAPLPEPGQQQQLLDHALVKKKDNQSGQYHIGNGNNSSQVFGENEACNESDNAIWENRSRRSDPSPFAGITFCARPCAGVWPCTMPCLLKEGWSHSCAACWADLGACSAMHCGIQCAVCLTEIPCSSHICRDCVDMQCKAKTFWKCSGLPLPSDWHNQNGTWLRTRHFHGNASGHAE